MPPPSYRWAPGGPERCCDRAQTTQAARGRARPPAAVLSTALLGLQAASSGFSLTGAAHREIISPSSGCI